MTQSGGHTDDSNPTRGHILVVGPGREQRRYFDPATVVFQLEAERIAAPQSAIAIEAPREAWNPWNRHEKRKQAALARRRKR